MPEHYTTADGVDVTEGDTMYLVSPYYNRILVKRVGRLQGRYSSHREGKIPVVGGTWEPIELLFASKDKATAFVIQSVERKIEDGLKTIKQTEGQVKRLRKLAAVLREQITAEGSITP